MHILYNTKNITIAGNEFLNILNHINNQLIHKIYIHPESTNMNQITIRDNYFGHDSFFKVYLQTHAISVYYGNILITGNLIQHARYGIYIDNAVLRSAINDNVFLNMQTSSVKLANATYSTLIDMDYNYWGGETPAISTNASTSVSDRSKYIYDPKGR